MPVTYPHPPTRSDYETAKSNLALLAGPTPPKTIAVPARPGDGKPAADVETNPAHTAYVQAQNTWHADRAVVAAYEGFADEHRDRYEDCRTRVDIGKGTTGDGEFVRQYEELLDAQVSAA